MANSAGGLSEHWFTPASPSPLAWKCQAFCSFPRPTSSAPARTSPSLACPCTSALTVPHSTNPLLPAKSSLPCQPLPCLSHSPSPNLIQVPHSQTPELRVRVSTIPQSTLHPPCSELCPWWQQPPSPTTAGPDRRKPGKASHLGSGGWVLVPFPTPVPGRLCHLGQVSFGASTNLGGPHAHEGSANRAP